MRSRALRLALVIALLAAWQNALVHPIAHVGHDGELVHLASGPAEHGGDGKGPNALCDAIAAVAAACTDGAPPLAPAAAAAAQPRFEFSRGVARSATLLAYRSQAPPTLL